MGKTIRDISVIIPALNAADTIASCLAAILAQKVDRPFDVTVAVGPCADDTALLVSEIAARDARVSMIDNPTGRTPDALNAAIAASNGDLVARIDAQSIVPLGYVQRLVDTAERTGAANVGGLQVPLGDTPRQSAIAAAMSSSFGAGPAPFRASGTEGPVDTVYLGAFDRQVLVEVGGFAEALTRNQDYELNWRIRKAGHVVWIDPELRVDYRPRSTFRALASQYFQYGRWKRYVLIRHPRSLRIRQLAAPTLVIALGVSVVALVSGFKIGLVMPAVYVGAVVLTAARVSRPHPVRRQLEVAAAFAIMHLAWGAGFLVGRRR